MAKLSMEEVERIIQRDVPGHRVVRESLGDDAADRGRISRTLDSARSKAAGSDAVSPGLDALRQKLRDQSGDRAGGALDSRAPRGLDKAADGDDDADEMIVAVRPEASPSPFETGYRTKAVVISGKSKRVIGRQG